MTVIKVPAETFLSHRVFIIIYIFKSNVGRLYESKYGERKH